MAQDNDIQQTLQDGIAAARRGDLATGRRLLRRVIEQDPENELAWIWLASCMTTVAERRKCLERVLEINPDNTRAQQALRALGGPAVPPAETPRQPRQTAAAPVDDTVIQQLRETPATERAGAAPRTGGVFNLENIIYGILILVIIAGSVFVASRLGDILGGGDPTPTPAVAIVNTPVPVVPQVITPTLPPLPTLTPRRFDGTSLAPTLPPTFTPTPTPLPTSTPPPTATPIPQDSFVILFTSLAEGQTQPDLYRMQGDGSDVSLVAEAVGDVAIDPTGERIAFVRNVTITDEETGESGTWPELFVAPLDDPAAAQPITDLRTTIVSSPTWSPEGEEILFVNDFDGDEEIWYITPDGNNLRQLTFNDSIDRQPAWQPVIGSRMFAFASDRNSRGSTEIFVMEVTEPGVDPVIDQLTDDVNSSYDPAWNANGTRIVFISDRQSDADVYLMDADGRGQRLITRDDSSAEDRSPHLSPDGRYVAFISNRQDDRFQTYLISVDSTVLTRLTDNDRSDIMLTYRPELIFRLQ
ncbi:MAG: hypothetical protein ACOCYT_02365 [Chloroflexota bacterium]